MVGMDKGFRHGRFEITTVLDADCFEIDLARIFPMADPALLSGHAWLAPDHADLGRGVLNLSMHSFVIRTGSLTILVDTCIGDDKERPAHDFWHRRSGGAYLARLAAIGVRPADVDMVFCTHLHADHVGWNTRLENGRWTPTFPNARYAMAAEEVRHWADRQARLGGPHNHGSYHDSVLPVINARQHLLVKPGDELSEGVTVRPLFGHTPAHVGLEVLSEGRTALFCGDAIHSPVQFIRPDWFSAFCDDPERSVATRRAMLEQAAEEDILLCPAHFRGRHVTHIRREGDGFAMR